MRRMADLDELRHHDAILLIIGADCGRIDGYMLSFDFAADISAPE